MNKLDEIEKLCNSATEGPWIGSYRYRYDGDEDKITSHGVYIEDGYPYQFITSGLTPEDTEFIAASRELMPKLLKVARAADEYRNHGPLQSLYDALDELEGS